MLRRTTAPLLAAAAAAFAAAPAQAQDMADYDYANLVLSGIGAHVSWVMPAHTSPALGLNVRADLGLLGPNVRISPGLTFWASELRDTEVARIEERIEAACDRGGVPCPGIELGEVEISDLSIDVDAHFLFTTDFGIEPYAGAGVSLHLLNGSGDFIDDTYVEELLDAIAPGLSLIGGVEVPMTRNLRLMGEARGVLTGNVRYLSVGVGGAWEFPAELRRRVVPSTEPPPPPPPPADGGAR